MKTVVCTITTFVTLDVPEQGNLDEVLNEVCDKIEPQDDPENHNYNVIDVEMDADRPEEI